MTGFLSVHGLSLNIQLKINSFVFSQEGDFSHKASSFLPFKIINLKCISEIFCKNICGYVFCCYLNSYPGIFKTHQKIKCQNFRKTFSYKAFKKYAIVNRAIVVYKHLIFQFLAI
jgi:hypothetical protein